MKRQSLWDKILKTKLTKNERQLNDISIYGCIFLCVGLPLLLICVLEKIIPTSLNILLYIMMVYGLTMIGLFSVCMYGYHKIKIKIMNEEYTNP